MQDVPSATEPATIRFTLDGETVEARAGDSIASAMIAAGHYRFRDDGSGRARGLFCGMGVCGECQVLVDGVPARACLEKARNGATVSRQSARRVLPRSARAAPAGRWSERAADVLVVGAGPAGLAAAAMTAAQGLDTMVVDERPQPGGQYYKQPAAEFPADPRGLDRQFRDGRRLIARALAAGVRHLGGAVVWGAFDGPSLAVTVDGETFVVRPRRLLIATGAYERPLPVPGWTLPGVMTTGAAQTLLRSYRTTPGRRVLVAGNGPLNFQVARELVRAGSKVVAIVEEAASPLASPLQFLRMALADPRLAADGIRQVAGLRLGGCPIEFGRALVRLDGDERVRAATVARVDAGGRPLPGTETEFAVDAVCMNYGFLPQAEIARALGCEFGYAQDTATWAAVRDADGRTTVPEVFVVGDASGLGGARIAMDEGALAGIAVVRDLLGDDAVDAGRERRLRRALRRHGRFQSALWTMFRAPLLDTQLAAGDTLACRCEEVSFDQLRSALSESCHRLASIKKRTRAGMGRCQGRYCAVSLAAAALEAGHGETPAGEFFAPRPPFKPMPLAQLAGAFGEPVEPRDLLRTNDRYANISP